MKKEQQRIYWKVEAMRIERGSKLGWELVETFRTAEAADDWIRNRVFQGDFYGDYRIGTIEMIF